MIIIYNFLMIAFFAFYGSCSMHAHHSDFKNEAAEAYTVTAYKSDDTIFGSINNKPIKRGGDTISWDDSLKNPDYWILEYPGLKMKVHFDSKDTIDPSGFHSKQITNSNTSEMAVTVNHSSSKTQSIKKDYVVQPSSTFTVLGSSISPTQKQYYYDPETFVSIQIGNVTLLASEQTSYQLKDSQGIVIQNTSPTQVTILSAQDKDKWEYPIKKTIKNTSGMDISVILIDENQNQISPISSQYPTSITIKNNESGAVFYDKNQAQKCYFKAIINSDFNTYIRALLGDNFTSSGNIEFSSIDDQKIKVAYENDLSTEFIQKKQWTIVNKSAYSITVNGSQNTIINPNGSIKMVGYKDESNSLYWDTQKPLSIQTNFPVKNSISFPNLPNPSNIRLDYNNIQTLLLLLNENDGIPGKQNSMNFYLSLKDCTITISDMTHGSKMYGINAAIGADEKIGHIYNSFLYENVFASNTAAQLMPTWEKAYNEAVNAMKRCTPDGKITPTNLDDKNICSCDSLKYLLTSEIAIENENKNELLDVSKNTELMNVLHAFLRSGACPESFNYKISALRDDPTFGNIAYNIMQSEVESETAGQFADRLVGVPLEYLSNFIVKFIQD